MARATPVVYSTALPPRLRAEPDQPNSPMKFNHLGLILASSLATLTLAHGTENPPVTDLPSSHTNLWSGLKTQSYDQRDVFLTGLQQLETRVDDQISELVIKRAAMEAQNTSTMDWDFAMQELGRARTTLLSTSADMAKADRNDWDQLKDKVGLAWVWTQDAYAKVKASTTNRP
jgi:hypothetical protein